MIRPQQLDAFLRRTRLEPSAMDSALFIERFVKDMRAGMNGGKCSLGMIPTYLSGDSPLPENSMAVAIDAGGTNFRSALLRFDGAGAHIEEYSAYPMPGTHGEVSWSEFIGFAANCVKPYLKYTDRLGFCISFPIEITPEHDGFIHHTTKEVLINGYEGRLVCTDLRAALDMPELRATLINDTTAVLLSGLAAGADSGGLVGLINGTGTNVCCQLSCRDMGIDMPGRMIVDVESGGFVPPERGKFDLELDRASSSPGVYLEEKMVSGAYLGELCLMAMQDAARGGMFSSEAAGAVLSMRRLDTPDADAFGSGGHIDALTEGPDAEFAREIVRAVFERAAKHIACTLSAVAKTAGTGADGIMTVSADGSMFRKSRLFRPALEKFAVRYVPAREIRYIEMDDSTIIGTAIGALMT